MNQQLSIDVPVEPNSTYAAAKEAYLKDKKILALSPVFLCYNRTNKEYFVSRFFSRNYIETSQKSIEIAE